ncbi:MAG: divalent-cation tolerance protein CutA [Alphaproteobacteria bacterium]
MTEIYIVTSMFATHEDARSVAHALIEQRLAACVNIHGGITSVYRWQGAVQQEQEVMLSAKTTKERCQAAIDAIKRLHPYDLPSIIAQPVSDGSAPFLAWVAEETT